MTFEQIALFGLFGLVLALLVWGRIRFDLVAFAALMLAVVLGIIPVNDAFAGFGHPATIIIALVFIISRGLSNSGALDLVSRSLIRQGRSLTSHIAVMGGLGAALSAFMNNVAALTLLMPIELAAAAKEKRSPALTLMPLAFATILGGLITLIGTPPNIIISQFRATATGEPFQMFDFAPVGLIIAVVGVAFIALVGWRLIPQRVSQSSQLDDLRRVTDYIAELSVPADSLAVGKLVMELDEAAEAAETVILGLIRDGRRFPGRARTNIVRPGDVLVVEATPESLDRIKAALQLDFFERSEAVRAQADSLILIEAVVEPEAPIQGRSAENIRLMRRQGIVLLGISRRGQRLAGRIRQERIEAGDILLLLGSPEQFTDIEETLGVVSLAPKTPTAGAPSMAPLAAGIFAAAILVAALGFVSVQVALGIAIVFYVVLGIVPPKDIYREIEWPVVVLVGSLLPLGMALETTGGSDLLATALLGATNGFPPGLVLLLVMLATMALTDVLNNSATALIVAPIAMQIANRLGVSVDPFLMGVAVASSCAFLTPIGHQNNTLVMGVGGYRFGDYWRIGLPLELIILVIAVPAIMVVWPF